MKIQKNIEYDNMRRVMEDIGKKVGRVGGGSVGFSKRKSSWRRLCLLRPREREREFYKHLTNPFICPAGSFIKGI